MSKEILYGQDDKCPHCGKKLRVVINPEEIVKESLKLRDQEWVDEIEKAVVIR